MSAMNRRDKIVRNQNVYMDQDQIWNHFIYVPNNDNQRDPFDELYKIEIRYDEYLQYSGSMVTDRFLLIIVHINEPWWKQTIKYIRQLALEETDHQIHKTMNPGGNRPSNT